MHETFHIPSNGPGWVQDDLATGPAVEFATFRHRGWVETLHARFREHAFNRHSHDNYAFGGVIAGAEGFWVEGAKVEAPAGTLVFYGPGDVHDGFALAPEGWEYRMLYIATDWFRDVAWEANLQPGRECPRVPKNTLRDPDLQAILMRAHADLQADRMLAGGSRLVQAVTGLLARHGGVGEPRRSHCSAAVRQAMRLLSDRLDDNVTLEELAGAGNVSRFHLLQSFKDATGLPPHRWQVNQRIARAKDLLRGLQPLSAIALDLGFHDQSHFTTAFKRHVGTTPAAYRRAVA